MRSRNVKPGFYRNELLGAADPLISLLFAGLWCLADRAGRLEDRPLRICAEIFPYRRAVTEKKVHGMLSWLDHQGFITRYEVDGRRYIQILAFSKHQSPHVHEKPSEIPALNPNLHGADTVPSTGKELDKHGSTPVASPGPHSARPSDSLIPDSSPPEKPPLPPRSGGASGRKRANGANPRARGTNPRAIAEILAGDATWQRLRDRAQASGFRAAYPVESADVYETQLRLHERDKSYSTPSLNGKARH